MSFELLLECGKVLIKYDLWWQTVPDVRASDIEGSSTE